MTLDINGYNSIFKSFVSFAQERHDANQVKAVADAHVNRLDGHRVLAVTHSETDEVHKWLRTRDEYRVNDRTRDYFKKAIIDMFGGESKIPDSVKEAMIMDDYNAGKPLTARRILAVKAAIDADGTAKARAAKIRLETFSPEVKAAALGMGYTKAELPKLARAAHFYAEVNNCAEFEALEALTTPGSKANRLLGYGGRFLKSAANFREGLRLLDSFATWYTATKTTLDATGKNYQEGMPKTILNATDSYFKPDTQCGMEKFIFEEIASNASLNLAEQDPEKVFGMENNAATRFFGRGLGWSFTQTVANIPPAKRAAFYAALDTAFPLVTDVAIARLPLFRRPGDQISTINKGIVLARVMKNLDKLAALVAKGGLTVKAFVKICFPESREKTLGAVGAMLKRWNAEIRGGDDIEAKYPWRAQPACSRHGPSRQLQHRRGPAEHPRRRPRLPLQLPGRFVPQGERVGGRPCRDPDDRRQGREPLRRRPPRAGVVRDHDAHAGGPRQPARRTRRIRHRLERARPR